MKFAKWYFVECQVGPDFTLSFIDLIAVLVEITALLNLLLVIHLESEDKS